MKIIAYNKKIVYVAVVFAPVNSQSVRVCVRVRVCVTREKIW